MGKNHIGIVLTLTKVQMGVSDYFIPSTDCSVK